MQTRARKYSTPRKRAATPKRLYTPHSVRRRSPYQTPRVGRTPKISKAIGERVGTTACKTNSFGEAQIQCETSTLYTQPINDIVPGTAIDNRLRDIVNLRGFTLHWEMYNLPQTSAPSDTQLPVYFHVAILGIKETEGNQVNADKFFRGNNNTRAINFNEDLSAIQLDTLSINTDDYFVLYHRRMLIGGTQDNAQENGSRAQYRRGKKYIKVNRQVRYNTDSQIPTDGRCFLVWYADWMTRPGFNAEFQEYVFSARVITWFKEPKT